MGIIFFEKRASTAQIGISAKPDYFLQLSPIGKVPVLKEDDGTVIWDSSLIAEYIEQTYPHPHLCPQEFHQRLACRKWEEMADTLGDTIIRAPLKIKFRPIYGKIKCSNQD